jgi:hypothetical protein
VPIELFVLPVLGVALALLVRRSPYWSRKRSFAPAAATLRSFFAASGTETSAERLDLLRVDRLDPPLAPYAPMLAVIAIGPEDESHVELLVEEMKRLHGENQRAAGFLFYLEPPSAVALLRMAEARLNQLAVIPIPLAQVERLDAKLMPLMETLQILCGSGLVREAGREQYEISSRLFRKWTQSQ